MRWSRFPGRVLAGLILVLALGVPPVLAAPPACAPEIVGPWTGKVWDQGRYKVLRTDFSTRSGELTGIYHVEEEEGGYDGTLTDFTPSGPCAGTFHWHDRFGDGVVQVDFRPDRDRFDGEWGSDKPLKDYIFNGRRIRPVPVG